MQVQKVIEALGYTSREAKVYLTALSLGECTVSDVAATLKLPRTSVQLIVEKLHADGLLQFYVMRRYKYWVAENPARLLALLEKREECMREALPTLSELQKTGWKKRRAKKRNYDWTIFRTIADSSQQPVLIANEDVQILHVNSAWESMFGYALSEVLGENPRILQSGKTTRDVYEKMWSSLHAGTLFQSTDIIDKKKNGTCVRLLTTILPLTHNGRTYYIQMLDARDDMERVAHLQQRFTNADS